MVTLNDLKIILPEIILAGGAVITMLMIALRRNPLVSGLLALATFALAFGVLINQGSGDYFVSNLFLVDAVGRFLTGLILCASFVIVLMSYTYFNLQKVVREEYYILLILATLGAVGMVISHHFVSFVLSLELLSVSVFALIGYLKKEKLSIEAATKYLIMAAVATSFILFGFALMYAATGAMSVQALLESQRGTQLDILFLAGMGLVMVGFGFKMALVPFHFWTPDIYSGAPAPVAAFVATISKGAAFIFLLRLFYSTGGLMHTNIWLAFATLAVASMFIGNWLGLKQQNLKRLLAYSSISHLGYLMVSFLAFSQLGVRASLFYLLVYFASILAAFGLITYFSNEEEGEPVQIENFRGLFWSRPWLAAFLTLVMLSLAGIPFTAGFMGKFYILTSGMATGSFFLLLALVISSTIGLFYYLRVVTIMLARSESKFSGNHIGNTSIALKVMIAALFILLLWLGIYPDTFFNLMGL